MHWISHRISYRPRHRGNSPRHHVVDEEWHVLESTNNKHNDHELRLRMHREDLLWCRSEKKIERRDLPLLVTTFTSATDQDYRRY